MNFAKRLARKFYARFTDHMLDTRIARDSLFERLEARKLYPLKLMDDHNLVFAFDRAIGLAILSHDQFCREDVISLRDFLGEHGYPTEGMNVLELGANIGTQTLYFFMDMNVGRVLAVEADPTNFQLLQANVAMNGFCDRGTCVQAVVSDEIREATFVCNLQNRGGSAIRNAPRFQKHQEEHMTVTTKPTKAVVTDAGWHLGDVDLIWMDVESHELEVFRGFGSDFAINAPPAYFEVAAGGTSSRRTELAEYVFGVYQNFYRHIPPHLRCESDASFVPISREEFLTEPSMFDVLALNPR